MEGRGRSRRRSLHREWKKRLSSVLAVVLTAVMILNMPLSIDGLRMHISDAFASGDNAGRNSVWATASNAHKEHGDSQDVDIYVIADEEAVPGNRSSMTLYLKNNTDQAISEGVLEFSGKYIEKEDASFTDIGSGEEVSQVIIAGPGQETEASGEGMLYQESGNETGSVIGQDIVLAENDDALPQTDADDEMDGIEDEAEAAEDAGETDEEEPWKLTSIDLQPGELHEVYFEFYTDDDVESTKANVTFKFHGENEDGKRIAGESKFYYSIGLPHVNISLEDGMQIESGVPNDMEIWMSEPDWVDEDLEDRIEEQEEEEAEKEMEEDTESEDTASDSQADKASNSDASRADNASDSNADKNTGNEDGISQEDAEKIHKYTEEAMEISESKVSYTVTVFGMQLSDFQARKTQEAEDIGWISCIYEAARDTQPGIYYGKVTAVGKWNKRAFTSEQGFLFEVTGEGKTGQEFTEELSNMTVHAYAEEGILPDGVQMKVTELSQDKEDTAEQYKKAVQALNDHEVSYDGMLAVDISFINEEGEEIEPDGEVQVSIQMKKDALPEDVDLGTVEVHHLKELDAETVIPEAVADGADKTDGTVQSAEDAVVALEEEGVPEEEIKAAVDEDAAAVAMFSVDGFSTFTITWEWQNGSQSVQLRLVDTEGNEISKWTNDQKITTGNTLALTDIAPFISLNHEYVGATYEGVSISYIRATQISQDVISVQYASTENVPSEDDWKNINEGSNIINLVYEITDDVIPSITAPQISHEKYADFHTNADGENDGTYDLTLNVSGKVGSVTNPAKLDVVFVLDKSGSMNWPMDRDLQNSNQGNGERMEKAKQAIATLANSLSQNENLDARFSLVTFSGNGDTWFPFVGWMGDTFDDATQDGWVMNSSDISNQLNQVSPNGGTNYQAGLLSASEMLNEKREDAITAVIFVSDGNPTYYYNEQGYTVGDGSEYDENANEAAKNTVSSLLCDYFFAVGVGPKGNYNRLQDLKNDSIAPNKEFYEGTDEEALKKAFDDIQASITTLTCSDVTITDILSENVQIVTAANGEPEQLIVKVIPPEGEPILGEGSVDIPGNSGQIIAHYDQLSKKITLEFPDDYELKEGYTYSVTAHIEPTEIAYQNYRNNNLNYPDIPDRGTGIHGPAEGELQNGFYSNADGGSMVTYTYNGEQLAEEYLKPVIKLTPGTLIIEKSIEGIEPEKLENLEFLITLNGMQENVSFSEFTGPIDGVYRYVIDGLSPNTVYSIVENNAEISNYDLKVTALNENGTIGKNETIRASFKNQYSISIQPPTGLTTNNYPYWLMLAIAAVGATSFIYPACRRRRHKGDR